MKSLYSPLSNQELDQVLYNFILLMQKKNQLDQKIDARDLITPLKEALLNAKDQNDLQINRDLFTSDAGIKKIMSLVIAASLQKQFADDPTLKNTFNVKMLALFLFDKNQPEKDHQFIQDRILKLQAKYAPQLTPGNRKQNIEATQQKKPSAPEENLDEKLLEAVYLQMTGQTHKGGFVPIILQEFTNSAGYVEQPGANREGIEPGGGILKQQDDNFKKIKENFNHAADEIFLESASIVATTPYPRLTQ